MDKMDMEVYHQTGGAYVVPIEIMNVLLDENESLTKGIDKTIEKYEKLYRDTDKLAEAHFETLFGTRANYRSILSLNKEIIQDLKSLKNN